MRSKGREVYDVKESSKASSGFADFRNYKITIEGTNFQIKKERRFSRRALSPNRMLVFEI